MRILICGLLAIALTGCNKKQNPESKRLISRLDCAVKRTLDGKTMTIEYYKKLFIDGSSLVAGSIRLPGTRHVTMKNYKNESRLGSLGQVTVKTDDEFFVTVVMTGDSKGVIVNFPAPGGMASVVSSYKECTLTGN
jgi:hypothetical protein